MLLVVVTCILFRITLCELTDIVDTKYGPVQGSKIPLHTGQTINSFLGIPFAKPPIGELRFKNPEEADSWTDVLQATTLRSICVQSPEENGEISTHPGWSDQSENCLFLNIFTPEEAGIYPVMVWLHGGGFISGSSLTAPGHFLAAKDVIVVVPNYRLGNIGFATTGNDLIPGNAGMMDQVLALRFVQENIEAFGGNPDQVTIFGESAGGVSVGLHVVSPLSAGLFHQAILQSGSEICRWGVNGPSQHPENYIVQVAEEVGCVTEDQEQMVECLRSVSARSLVDVVVNCNDAGYFCYGMSPVVDGNFLPEMPHVIREKGEHNKVPEIMGVNKEDGYIYVLIFGVEYLVRGLTRAEFVEAIDITVDFLSPSFTTDDRLDDVNQAMQFFYTDWANVADRETNRNMLGDLLGDGKFLYPADIQAKANSKDADTYFYIYGHVTENSLAPKWLGAFHGSDLLYSFGFPFFDLNDAAKNDSGVTNVLGNYTQQEREFSDYVMTLWTNFAKHGTPTLETTIPPGGDEAVLWPKYGADDYKYMYLDRQVFVGENYRQEYVAFWTEYLNWMAYDKVPR